VFTAACEALERGELAMAALHSDTLAARFPGSAEAAVLSTFVERRAGRGTEPWLESLLGSWESCGRPTGFCFLKGQSWNALVDEAMVTGTAGDALVEYFSDNTGILGRTWLLTEPAMLLEEAVEQLSRPGELLARLSTAGQLASVKRDPELKERAQALIVPLHQELAAAHPTTFELAALPVIDDVVRVGRIEPEHVENLSALLQLDARQELTGLLYRGLLRQRGAQSAQARRLAFLDVALILPDPAFTLWCRARDASVKSPQLLELLKELGQREAASVWAMRRVVGLELLKVVAESEGHTDTAESLGGLLDELRRLLDEPSRFDPDWPIEPLRCELSDALATDELGVLSRCAFP
jgi:hypothetical protein